MSAQVTHTVDPETGHLRQIVPARVLRAILRRDGESLRRPSDFGAEDEWNVGDDEGGDE